MARIVINDLMESQELDRAAMRQITGGQCRQLLSPVPVYESSLFEKQDFCDRFSIAGFNFDPNRG